MTIFLQIAQFQKRFKRIPTIIELDHLTVTGDVYFGRNITLRGTVISTCRLDVRLASLILFRIVVANEGQRIDIPDGCVLENSKIYSNCDLCWG